MRARSSCGRGSGNAHGEDLFAVKTTSLHLAADFAAAHHENAVADTQQLLDLRRNHQDPGSVRGQLIDDPVNFDLTLNTYALPLAMQATMLAELALAIDQTVGPENWQQMRDAAVAAEVHAALVLHPKIGHAPFAVQCREGRVQINGPGLVPPWDGLINEVARQVEGVRTVEVLADEQPVPVRPN